MFAIIGSVMALAEVREHTEFARRARARHDSRVAAWDRLADVRDRFRQKNAGYHAEIERVAKSLIPKGARVLDIGCSTGDLLAALEPSRGLGIDFSPRTIEKARSKHPQLEFRVGDAEDLNLDEQFDYVVMSDVVGQLDDVWAAFRSLRHVMQPESRLLVTYWNFVWMPALKLARLLGQKSPIPEENWLGRADLRNLLELNDLEVVQEGTGVLLPARVPLLASLANRWLAKLPGLWAFNLVQYFLARPTWQNARPARQLSVSVVVPCRNERGNVVDIFARTPELGKGTELIFVDGNSDDGTVEEIEKRLSSRPRTKLIHQGDGKGKGDAVRKGFAAATGDVLYILDADLTVPPEDLEKFHLALAEGHGDFVNGTRLVYPMEGEAMRFLNLLGNKFFSLAFTYILGRPIKDTLCGTKVLSRQDYQKIVAGRAYFGDFDPFGDFDLLFGAAKAGLKIVEVPVRYRARTYGDTKISRFKHGWLLLRMTILGFRKLKLGA